MISINMEKNKLREDLALRIGYLFVNEDLAVESVTHRSYQNEHPDDRGHNERLEFLGDAVLDLIVAEALMERLEDAPEGQLTRRRAALVNEESLARVARELDLGPILRLGRGEEKNNGRQKASILADAIEAIVAAIYLDGGYYAARDTVMAWYGVLLGDIAKGESPQDPKTVLQEKLQAHGDGIPFYNVVGSNGPDHDKMFEVEVMVAQNRIARGTGKSKKEAEKDAALKALAAERNWFER